MGAGAEARSESRPFSKATQGDAMSPPASQVSKASAGVLGRRTSRVSKMSAPEERAITWTEVLERLMAGSERYATVACHYKKLPGAVCRLLLWQSPIGVCLLRCVFHTSKMRVLLHSVDTMGSVMLGTVFYTTTGTVPSKKNRSSSCSTPDVAEAIGRLTAIAIASVVLSSLPAIFLGSLCTRGVRKFAVEGSPEWNRQLMAWKIQDVIIYTVGTIFALLSLFFVSLFLANTAVEDQRGWLVSIVLSLALDNVISPLTVALVVPLLAAFCLSLASCIRKKKKEEIVDDAVAEIASKQNVTLEIMNV